MGLISEDSLNVEIPDEDLQLGFSRACGSGGQNVNKVESVVRITRIPTGVTVRCTGNSDFSCYQLPLQMFSLSLAFCCTYCYFYPFHTTILYIQPLIIFLQIYTRS
ncbi:putative peptide chain release factor class I [Helianthus debilis subsp. tardiflorus]